MINSLAAIKQPLDFEKLYPFTACCSDIDGLFELNNGKLVLVEIKKNTLSHDKENYKHSVQNMLFNKLIGNRSDIFYVYATHDLNINEEVPIESSDCTVQFVFYNGKEYKVPTNITLLEFIKEQSRHEIIKDEYYIVVKYPNGNLRYCIAAPKGNCWITDNYNENLNKFNSYQEASNYISARFLKPMNMQNEYLLFRKNKENDTLINIFKYKQNF